MFLRLRMAVLAVIFTCFGPSPGNCTGFGPPIKEGHFMADEKEKKAPVVPVRATQATTRPTMVPLNEFVLIPEQFCHRDKEELDDAVRLQPLIDSLAAEGLQTPVEFFREQGMPVVVKGHRRISSLRILAERMTPGFDETMGVESIEVCDATAQDLVVRSILDNQNRLSFSDLERIRASKTLHDNGVSAERAANALGIVVKTFQRDLIIAQHPWMLEMIVQNAVAPSNAARLLEAAVKNNRISALREDLVAWIGDTESQIAEQQAKKALRPAQQLVKTYMTKPLVDHWLAQLAKKKRFDSEVPAEIDVDIDVDAEKVSFRATEIDLRKVPLPQLAKIVSDIETAKSVMTNYLKIRHAAESLQGPQDLARIETQKPSGLDFLRNEGLGDLAEMLTGTPPPSMPEDVEASDR